MLSTVITANFHPLCHVDAFNCHHCQLPSPVSCRCFQLSSLPTSIPCVLLMFSTVITANVHPLCPVDAFNCHHCQLPSPVSCRCFQLSSLPTSIPCVL
nr:hypothetical protein BgiMline_032329 [Biomphalaria glabrata]